MTVDEAKAVLGAWRPDGSDHADPAFRQALEMARQDPELLNWLHEQQEFDSAMTQNLRAVHAPAEARAQILANGRATLRRRAIGRKVFFVAAAALLTLATVGLWQFQDAIVPELPASGFTLAAAAEDLSVNHKSMEFYSKNAGELRAWLTKRGSPTPRRLPGRLSALEAYGTQDWHMSQGRISLMCFYPETHNPENEYDENSEWVHFFTFSDEFAQFPDATPTPRFVEEDQWVFVIWTEDETAFALGLPAKAGARERLRVLIGA